MKRCLMGLRAVRVFLAMLLIVAAGVAEVAAQVAVRGKKVYTMAGPAIEDGVVVIREGKIAAVGRAGDVNIPAGFRVLEAAVVTPGLIDAHTVVGLSGQFNYDHDQDQLERSSAIQPQLRAIDAYNPRERLVEWVRGFGVTTMHTGHAPGELISGQTMIVKTTGDTADEAALVHPAAVATTLGEAALKGRGGPRSSGGAGDGRGSPGTRGKMIAMLREKLVAAQAYRDKRAKAAEGGEGGEDGTGESPERNLELETLVEVLEGRLPLMVTAHRSQDLANALRVAKEFELRLILDGASESYLLIDQIKAAGVPVILHPTMIRANGETENMSFETASKLIAAGIPVALQSGYEAYVPKTRVVLYEAGWAAANGLTFAQALGTITIEAAKILGIDERVGSLAVGKDGDVALYDGDPFEYTTHCVGVVIGGAVVSEEKR